MDSIASMWVFYCSEAVFCLSVCLEIGRPIHSPSVSSPVLHCGEIVTLHLNLFILVKIEIPQLSKNKQKMLKQKPRVIAKKKKERRKRTTRNNDTRKR